MRLFLLSLSALSLVLAFVFASPVSEKEMIFRLRSGDFQWKSRPTVSSMMQVASDSQGFAQWLLLLKDDQVNETTMAHLCGDYKCEILRPQGLYLHAPRRHIEHLLADGVIYEPRIYDESYKVDPNLLKRFNSPPLTQQGRVFNLFSFQQTGTAPVKENIEIHVHFANPLLKGSTSNSPAQDESDPLISQWKSSLSHEQIGIRVLESINRVSDTVLGFSIAENEDIRVGDQMLRFFARQPEVKWIEYVRPMVLLNNYASAILESSLSMISGDAISRSLAERHLHGENQIVGIADSGLAVGHVAFNSSGTSFITDIGVKNPHFLTNSLKVPLYIYQVTTDKKDTLGGHGTHVAGTIAGKMGDSRTDYHLYDGVANEARIIFFDLAGGNGNLLNVPRDLDARLFSKLYAAGARVMSNSWGDLLPRDSMSQQDVSVDTFLYNHPDALVLFSAGNSGQANPLASSILSPAQAKNVIAVGASQSAQCITFSALYDSRTSEGIALTAPFGKYPTPSLAIKGPVVDVTEQDNVGCTPFLEGRFPENAWVLVGNYPNNFCSPVVQARHVQQNGGAGIVFAAQPTSYNEHTYSLSGEYIGSSDDPSDIVIYVIGIVDQRMGYSIVRKSSVLTVEREYESSMLNDVADFSARGPTYDGRVKPDIVAPGSFLLSAYANNPGNLWQSGLHVLEGTSMAAPAAAGAALLVRQYLTEGYYPTGTQQSSDAIPNPKGYLLKALLVNSARRMNGNVYLNPRRFDTPNQPTDLSEEYYPYRFQGHGRVDLDNVLYFPDSPFHLFIDDDKSLATGDQEVYAISLNEGQELAVTLSYYDVPNSVSVGLINVLTLTVEDPTGARVYGNLKSDLNTIDNVQKVIFYAAVSGTYTVTVHGHSVVQNSPQAYALVYTVSNRTCSYLCTVGLMASVPPNSRLSVGAWIGLGIAIAAGALLIVLVLFVVIYKYRKTRKRQRPSLPQESISLSSVSSYFTTRSQASSSALHPD